MKAKTTIIRMLVTVMLTFGLLPIEQSTSAQSAGRFMGLRGNSTQPASAQSANSNCKSLGGRGIQVFDPVTGVVSGPVTNAGILNGPLEEVIDFNAGVVFTPDPNVVAYTSDLTITTIHGELKASPVITQSIVTGVGAEWGNINPNTSTGIFAGATGMIFVTFKPLGDPSIGPYDAKITADICFAE